MIRNRRRLAWAALAAALLGKGRVDGGDWTSGAAPTESSTLFPEVSVTHSLDDGFRAGIESVNVFIGTKREAITSSKYPWSAIGRLRLAKGTGRSWCTASLVARDLILTNAHCIEDELGNIVKGAYSFAPNMVGGNSRTESAVVLMWPGTAGVSPDSRAEIDWAILRLKDPLGDSYGWLGVMEANFSVDSSVHLAAYSGDFQEGRTGSFSRDCRITGATSQGALLHDCSSTKGSSGGPLLRFDSKGQAWIVALNRGERRGNRNESLVNIPYSEQYANIAVPSSAYLPTLRTLIGK